MTNMTMDAVFGRVQERQEHNTVSFRDDKDNHIVVRLSPETWAAMIEPGVVKLLKAELAEADEAYNTARNTMRRLIANINARGNSRIDDFQSSDPQGNDGQAKGTSGDAEEAHNPTEQLLTA